MALAVAIMVAALEAILVATQVEATHRRRDPDKVHKRLDSQ